jgi:hypothetical protein
MSFWALLASGQIKMRKVDGWRSLDEKPSDQTIDLPPSPMTDRSDRPAARTVLLPVPDRLDVLKLPFPAVDQHLTIVALAGRQICGIDCDESVLSTARHMYICRPAIETTISSRCHDCGV